MMRCVLSLMLVLATCWASNPIFERVAPKHFTQEVLDNYRLPDNVVPTNYIIELTPHLDTNDAKNFSFNGHSQIDLLVKENSTTITFHAKQLDLKNTRLYYVNSTKQINITILNTIINKQKDFVTLILEEKIDPKKIKSVKLELDFTGKLNDELRGFYRSSYEINGTKRWLATTHFEPVGARQAFPCWDEPAIKATFDITIISPKNYHAVSNMKIKKLNNTERRTIFQTTPKMSTYLVAFVVSDYKNQTNKEGNFSVWTRPDAINSTNFAFEIGQKILKKLEEVTNISYNTNPNIKLDQISIPDFSAGAMENWGLVTYREPALLYTERKTTTQDKQAIATVIAHEFSHQWFGNLVTCDWWDYIWLNEGFATFFQYYITEQVIQTWYNESWHLMDQFIIKNLQASAFVVDATTKTRPLNSENAKTFVQIQSLFDDIAYQKGASIIWMLQQFLTKDIFHKGLYHYLTDNKYKPVKPDNLFDAIEKTGKKELKEILPNVTLNEVMDYWLNKPGYPVVTVNRFALQNSSFDRVNLTQERFFLMKPAKEDTTKWYIPITYVTEEKPETVKSVWMKPNDAFSVIDQLKNTNWIILNKNQTGYYRVNYDKKNWDLLAKYLKTNNYKNISVTNRAQLIDDALNLARAGYLKYDKALQITKYLSQESDYVPWYTAIKEFDYLSIVLQGSKYYDKYCKFVAHIIKKFVTEVNYKKTEDEHIKKLGKVLALNTACKYGLKDCKDFAYNELKKWSEGKKELSPDLRKGIICAGLRKNDIEMMQTWNKTKEKYKNSKDKDERADILTGLGCATSEEIIDKFLNLAIQKEIDIFSAMNSIAEGNANSFNILLNFINKHIEDIKKMDKNNTKLPVLLNKLANKITTKNQYTELSLVAYKHLQEFKKLEGLNQAIENLIWIKSYQNFVGKWIEENYDIEKNEPNSANSFTLASFFVIIPVLLARFN